MPTQRFRAEVVDGLLHLAEFKLPPMLSFSPKGHAAATLEGRKGNVVIVKMQHILVVESDSNSRGDCALCGKKTKFKCQTCSGSHRKGLWFCIEPRRNCWAKVHTL